MSRTLINQTTKQIGQEVTIKGWVESKRDHKKVVFLDVRDRSGLIQCVGVGELTELASVSLESVIALTGEIKERGQNNINPELATGKIELLVKSYEVLNLAENLPIPVDSDGREISEEPRLKYRYLDLRRRRLQENLRLRSDFVQALRQGLLNKEFVEIETPMLTQSTKEGARDFLVPSRFQPGKFYALPQSPQQYKQLLMTAGFERYFQLAHCIRDEDLRADRGFEFTQLDLEMSFVSREDVMSLVETVTRSAVQAVDGKLKSEQFPVYTYQEALAEFGQDKFDLRTDEEKEAGVLAFAWVINFPFFKQVDKKDSAEVADGKNGWTFTHNPFSQPQAEYLDDHLAGKNLGKILTTQYDLVCNGYEVGGGSLRAHQPEVLSATFRNMGYDEAEIEASVGHLLQAFSLGTPPHGGIALGIDRLAMVLAGEESIKEVTAFPMTSSGRTAVVNAPSKVSPELLKELGLKISE